MGILAQVGHPIALNPNHKLKVKAKLKGWTVTDTDTIMETVTQFIHSPLSNC